MLKPIGDLQSIPAEEVTVENINHKYALYIDYHYAQSGKIDSLAILNKDEPSEKIAHEIRIDGKDGYVGRALVALIDALETLKSIEDEIDAKIKQEAEKIQNEHGVPLIRVPGAFSKENTPEKRLPEYRLNVRRSRYDLQEIFFVIKGTEKEDTATKPPFKIEVNENGDFVSVSRKNVQPLVKELKIISQLPS
jgi:hypothetical protein